MTMSFPGFGAGSFAGSSGGTGGANLAISGSTCSVSYSGLFSEASPMGELSFNHNRKGERTGLNLILGAAEGSFLR